MRWPWSMPTVGQPRGCVNFGDAWTMGDISVAAWTARTQGDRVSQYVANTVGEVASPLSILWYDPRIKPEAPPASLQNVRLANDLVIGRTGWGERDSVVALRSGWPANHEHADRNSVIFAAHGERLFHDPYKAAYSYTDPHWNLRLTQSHTAVLIDGKGHQYHDGHEGTNASWAEAHIVAFEERKGDLLVTSDATEAYRLVLPRVTLVRRSVFFLKPDILILLDRIRVDGDPAPGAAAVPGGQFRRQGFGDPFCRPASGSSARMPRSRQRSMVRWHRRFIPGSSLFPKTTGSIRSSRLFSLQAMSTSC